MSKFYKKVTKYTNTYKKRINKFPFTDEEKLVFLTVGLTTVNSLIYFVGGLADSNSDYTGFRIKPWLSQLSEIKEGDIHRVLEDVTYEYLETTLNTNTTNMNKEKLESWKNSFERFTLGNKEEHLVDRVFPSIFLSDAIRNEMPVMTFVTIIDKMFFRLDVQLERALKQFYELKK